jgi:hypothetical protein
MKKIIAKNIIDAYENSDDEFDFYDFYNSKEVEALIKFVEEKLLPNVLDNKELKKEWERLK